MRLFTYSALVLSWLSYCVPLYAQADYKLIEDMLGRYPVLSYNGDRIAAGFAEIVADENGVGFKLAPLKAASHPIASSQLISGKNETTLTRTGNSVVQEAVIDGERVRVEYVMNDGFISVNAQFCHTDSLCDKRILELGNGKASGELVAMESFIDATKGQYKISTVNGVKPKEDAEIASVEFDPETKECILSFPYCLPNGTCDPGYLIFNCQAARVFKNRISATHENFTILDGVAGNQKRYTWDMDNGRLLFVNYQYLLPPDNESIVLEHVAFYQRW